MPRSRRRYIAPGHHLRVSVAQLARELDMTDAEARNLLRTRFPGIDYGMRAREVGEDAITITRAAAEQIKEMLGYGRRTPASTIHGDWLTPHEKRAP